MQVARRSHAAVLLRDGRALVAGGYQPIESLDSAEIFDPATGAWTRVASMHEGRSRAHGVLLDDGSVLVVGDGYEGVVEIYVPSEDVWRLGPPARRRRPAPRARGRRRLRDRHAGVALRRRRVDALSDAAR